MEKKRMGEILIDLGLIDDHRLSHALEVSKKNRNMKLGETLIRLGYVSEEKVLEILRNLTGVLTLNMTTWTMKKHAQVMLPPERMKEMKVLPLDANSKKAVVAFSDPLNYVSVENIKFLLNRDVTPVLASMAQIDDILAHLDGGGYGVKNLPLREVKRSIMDMAVQEMNASILLKLLDEPGATALHLSIGTSPVVRKGGQFKRSGLPIITSSIMDAIIQDVVPADHMETLKERKEVEYTYANPGLGRYRMNLYFQKGGEVTVAVKKLEEVIPSAEFLGIPEILTSLLDKRGLLLVSSIRGMGKDTTIASLVDHINSTQSCNIITFEDPIEYVHHHKMSNVNQRELGRDTEKNLDDVFDRVIKLDPDVLVFSNLKDLYAMDTAVLAANKGILVIAGINAMDVFSAVERFQSSLSDDYMRALFSRSILAVFSQRLIGSKTAKKRIMVYESLLGTPRIQKYIRDDKIYFVKGQAPSLKNEYYPVEESISKAIKEGRLDLESVKNEPWINQDTLKLLLER